MDNRRRIATTIPLAIPVAISLPFQWPIILPELGGGACPFPTVSPLLQNHFLVELSTENQRATPEATKRFEDDAENSGNNITDFVTCSSSNRR